MTLTVPPSPHASRPENLRPQHFLNGEIHDWYKLVLGYSDHLVGTLLDEFRITEGSSVLDPFCGSGTTLVEAMKRGVLATGIDANPSSYFASRVKTNWDLSGATLLACLERVKERYTALLRVEEYQSDAFCQYMEKEGFLKRRWIDVKPLRKTVAIKRAVEGLRTSREYKEALLLALLTETVLGSANVKFGPELYCGPSRRDASVFLGFQKRLEKMASDLSLVNSIPHPAAKVILGDARDCSRLLQHPNEFAALISSPPYPAEHDYTRNARLELAMLGAVRDRESLRKIKKTMIRSNTKGIYVGDSDSALVTGHLQIEKLARVLDERAESKTHGFARLYSTVLREYFGGMKRHLASVKPFLKKGALCAYVVGDQASYLQVHIPTAKILSSIAGTVGYKTIEIRHWRSRWSTATSRSVAENILILRKS